MRIRSVVGAAQGADQECLRGTPQPTQRTRRLGGAIARLLLVALSVAPTNSVSAQDGGSETPPQSEASKDDAVRYYQEGRAHYQAGRYREAVAALERAKTLDPHSPTLVYNLARVNELLGDLEAAIAYYREYLTMIPADQVDERAQVEESIARLEGAAASLEPESSATEAPEAPQLGLAAHEAERGQFRVEPWVFWSTAGTAAALLLSGAVTGALALRADADSDDFILGKDGSSAERDRLAHRADTFALTTDVLLGGGLVLGAAAATLFFFQQEDATPRSTGQVQAFLAPTWGGAFAGIRGSL